MDPRTATYNLFINEKVIILDASAEANMSTLAGASRLDPLNQDVILAATEAYQYAIDEITPDNIYDAIVLGDNEARRRLTKEWLLSTGRCRSVISVVRADLGEKYPFLLDRTFEELASHPKPNEIIDRKIFLGSLQTLNAQSIYDLGITHIVSVFDTQQVIPPPNIKKHIQCNIANDCSAELMPVLARSLPFIESALEENACVLVHCNTGCSRSASVVIAYLMQSNGFGFDDALAFVKARRPNVKPNDGFCRQLRLWEEVLKL